MAKEGVMGIGIFVLLIFAGSVYWTKPKCEAGYIPLFVWFDGWACTPGYKP